MKRQSFGKMPDGTPVDVYTLSNANGIEARITTYGGAVVSLTAPDRDGKFADVVLGMDSLDGYRGQSAFFGALIGRYGNRIGHGQFTLEGKTYQLPKNDGGNTLHGGPRGFDKKVWQAAEAKSAAGPALALTVRQSGRRRGLSRNHDRQSGVHLDQQERTGDRLQRHHRQADRAEPDQPFLFQPGRRGIGRHPPAPGDDRRRPVHAGGRGVDSDRGVARRQGHAVRFHASDGHRSAHRPERRAT